MRCSMSAVTSRRSHSSAQWKRSIGWSQRKVCSSSCRANPFLSTARLKSTASAGRPSSTPTADRVPHRRLGRRADRSSQVVMQALLSFDQAPPFAAPFRFFLTAPAFGMLAGALLLASGPDALASRWTPAALALTHLVTVGFMLQAMLGALLQIMPVVAGANLLRCRRESAAAAARCPPGAREPAARRLSARWRLSRATRDRPASCGSPARRRLAHLRHRGSARAACGADKQPDNPWHQTGAERTERDDDPWRAADLPAGW